MLPTGPNAASAFFLIPNTDKDTTGNKGRKENEEHTADKGHKGKSDGD